jgi:hypothetical protein
VFDRYRGHLGGHDVVEFVEAATPRKMYAVQVEGPLPTLAEAQAAVDAAYRHNLGSPAGGDTAPGPAEPQVAGASRADRLSGGEADG